MDSGLDFCPDFGFAFNNSNFSDRILLIEIVAEKENGDEAAASGDDRGGLLSNQKPRVGPGDDSNGCEDGSTVLGVKTLYISSPILAAKSPFFYKLFTNGMMESEQRDATLRINASEEAALMELLNFMYTNTLRANTAPALLDLVMAADKFEVTSCMRHCYSLLKSLALTPETALLYLNLPSGILLAEAFQPLIDDAKQFLVDHYKDVSIHQDEIMNLPLVGIEAILSSDDLQVASEDIVYNIALNWTEIHYKNAEERRDILSTCLGRYIRFPYLSSWKLSTFMSCNYFDRDFISKAVQDAMFFKADAPYHRKAHSAKDRANHFVERAYLRRPIKVVRFQLPRQQCVVYLDLKREECAGLFLAGRICSQNFNFGGQFFCLSARCYTCQQGTVNCFGVFVGMQEKSSAKFDFDYELGFRSKPSEKYISKRRGNYVFTGGKYMKYQYMVGIPWTLFIADDSPYFIDEVLHIRAELTVKR